MKKLIALALALTFFGATAASAEGIELKLGGDRGHERNFDGDRGSSHDFDRGGRHRNRRDAIETGGINCHTTVIRKQNDDGDVVTKRIRKCD